MTAICRASIMNATAWSGSHFAPLCQSGHLSRSSCLTSSEAVTATRARSCASAAVRRPARAATVPTCSAASPSPNAPVSSLTMTGRRYVIAPEATLRAATGLPALQRRHRAGARPAGAAGWRPCVCEPSSCSDHERHPPSRGRSVRRVDLSISHPSNQPRSHDLSSPLTRSESVQDLTLGGAVPGVARQTLTAPLSTKDGGRISQGGPRP